MSRASDAALMPLPSELTTPPVTKMNLAIGVSIEARLLQMLGRAEEVLRRVDRDGHVPDRRRADAHPGLHRAQLLQALGQLARRGRKAHEALQRLAGVAVDADMPAHRAFRGRARAGEVEAAP